MRPISPTRPTDLSGAPTRNRLGPENQLGSAFWISAAWIAAILFAVMFADVLPLRDPLASDFAKLKARPGLEYWFGTDVLALDIFSRVIY